MKESVLTINQIDLGDLIKISYFFWYHYPGVCVCVYNIFTNTNVTFIQFIECIFEKIDDYFG